MAGTKKQKQFHIFILSTYFKFGVEERFWDIIKFNQDPK